MNQHAFKLVYLFMSRSSSLIPVRGDGWDVGSTSFERNPEWTLNRVATDAYCRFFLFDMTECEVLCCSYRRGILYRGQFGFDGPWILPCPSEYFCFVCPHSCYSSYICQVVRLTAVDKRLPSFPFPFRPTVEVDFITNYHSNVIARRGQFIVRS